MLNINLWNKTRKEQKITLNLLSVKSGIPLNTLKNIFSGRTKTPRIDTVQAIERALGLTPAFTDEERALGLSENNLIAMSDKDRHRLHILAFAEEQLGVDFVDAQINLLEMAANAKSKEAKK